MFTAAFWDQLTNPKKKNPVTIEQVLADPTTHQNCLEKGPVIVDGDMAGAGKSFHPDGKTITDADHYQVVFKWDTTKLLHMLTAYPT